MSSNIIIFDADYVSELTSRMNTACELMADAVSSLRSASNHENWKCKERTQILDEFENLNKKLDRLDKGVNDTTRILGGSISSYEALESQYEAQAGALSEELTSNFGFSATVHTEGVSEGSGGTGTASTGTTGSTPNTPGSEGSGGSAGAAGAAGAGSAGAAGAGTAANTSGGQKGNSSGGIGIHMTGGGGQGGQTTGQEQEAGGQIMGGGNTMNVNLPVTHIPDDPDSAARGIKDTQEIADAAAESVVELMTEALAARNFGTYSGGTVAGAGSAETGGTGINTAAGNLVNIYNAGKAIYENSAAIMASPTLPHTAERLAMAAGIVTLAGTAAGAGLTALGQAAGTFAASGSASSVTSGSGNLAQNAGNISAALQGNNEAAEFRQVLGVFTASGGGSVQSSGILDFTGLGSSSSSGRSGSKKSSFFDMIVAELKKTFTGTQDGSSSSSIFSASSASSSAGSGSSLYTSSPIMEFLGNFVMDQAV